MARRALALLALGLLVPLPARAAFHLAVISEVLTSYGGAADLQAVEIEMRAGGQTLTENSVLAVFDATGAYVTDALVVPGDVPNGGLGVRWLMGTAAFETASGLEVDFEFAPALPVAGGMICWGAPGIVPPADPGSWDHADPGSYVDCVAYGSYAGASNDFIGTPTPLTAEGHSLRRISETHDNATDFVCGDPTDLENNAGATAELVATTACPAAPSPQSKAQQGCINALNRAGSGALKARSALARSCVGAYQKGKAASGADCIAADAKGKVAKAEGKTLADDAKSCRADALPDFAYAGGAAANDATELAAAALLAALFGADLDAALVTDATNTAAARCQAQALAAATKVADTYMKAALKAKKSVLKEGAADADAFLAAFSAALDQGKLAVQTAKQSGQIAARCAGADIPALFPGNCADGATVDALASCLTSSGQIQACAAFLQMDALPSAGCN